jgi:hypothetical protein
MQLLREKCQMLVFIIVSFSVARQKPDGLVTRPTSGIRPTGVHAVSASFPDPASREL